MDWQYSISVLVHSMLARFVKISKIDTTLAISNSFLFPLDFEGGTENC